MQVIPTALGDVRLILPKRFGDARGYFVETWNERSYAGHGLERRWVQDNQSLSATPGTVRGLHYQLAPHAQTKLVRVLRGRILDVVVDIRRGSATFGQHVAVELSADGLEQLFVPVGFAHGFCTLEPDTIVAYKVDAFYSPECERAVRWNDPALGIRWPEGAGSVVSGKDAVAPSLAEAADLFLA
ncbi:dTDP-4-dehydrorhamnose 3,5-epimerase [Azospirillum thermophilum]|uniref:dTDP-4-dehydrorhamnose 3,5-epimerase n=1 Tax=Azospirillum thermophilum TaxID=2202148 RepID=A0A2S2D0K0_9PROT|nr:dTDP-4-dehydrorhamnose 3,5-epimerase [Azospirillum thermophilum]AWK90180.1 dTDP-4-dehydrorhamnose 3,5-epimerase [Azospirillum thermophilum]